MDLETTGIGGDAATETPTASGETNSVSDAGVSLEAPPTAEPTATDSGATGTAPELTTEQLIPDAELTPEQLEEIKNDPRLEAVPWARAKVNELAGYTARLKGDIERAKAEAATVQSQYEPFNGLAKEDIDSMRTAQEKVYALSSIAATPEQIDEQIRELNPRAYEGLQTHLVWRALENSDGTPNLNNLQAVVDKFSGQPGAVKAQTVLDAVQALTSGHIKEEDLQRFSSPEEYAQWQSIKERESALEQRDQQLRQNAEYQETQARKSELDQAVINPQMQQVSQMIDPLLQRFNLTPQENEPKLAADYKADVVSDIRSVIGSAMSEIPAFKEIATAIDILGKARGYDAQKAAQEIQAFVSSPHYKQTSGQAMRELQNRIEQLVTRKAAHFSLMMKGYSQENAKPLEARPIPGNPNQATPSLGNKSPEELARMSAQERSRYVNEQTTAALNQLLGNGQRLG